MAAEDEIFFVILFNTALGSVFGILFTELFHELRKRAKIFKLGVPIIRPSDHPINVTAGVRPGMDLSFLKRFMPGGLRSSQLKQAREIKAALGLKTAPLDVLPRAQEVRTIG